MSARRGAGRAARDRLAGLGTLATVFAAACAGLGALHVVVRMQLPEPGRDAITVAYLRARLDRSPHDAALRLRLAREQLAVGKYEDAERTLSPLLPTGSTPAVEASLLQLDIAVAAWRAAPAQSRERAEAEERARGLLAGLVRDAMPRERFSTVARELGRPDLAGQNAERAASLDPGRCAAWLHQAARDYLAAGRQDRAAESEARAYACAGDPRLALGMGLEALRAYQAADMGREALRFADLLVERFPSSRELLERAVAIALEQGERADARRFGARLVKIGAADAAALRRQLDLALAAGDLGEALHIASEMVRRDPADARSRLTAAHVATWAGRRALALRNWMWLARRDAAAVAVEEALRLARAGGDSAAVAELLTLKSRRHPLSPASWGELAGALDRVGPPGRAAAVLEAHARLGGDLAAWERLAAFRERGNDLSGALATRGEMARRFGPSLVNSIRLAELQWALGRPGEALAQLRPWVDLAEPRETEYWQLLGDLAWDQEVDDVATRAYDVLWRSDRIDPGGAERLILLSRTAGRPEAVIHYGRQGWSRFRQPRLLLLAMDEAARLSRGEDLAELVAESTRAPGAFADIPAYWMLRAGLDASRDQPGRAVEDYRQALAADPKSSAARSAIIWLLAGAHEHEALSRCLAAWAADAPSDPALWRAYAAGLEQLGRRREALSFHERQARADPDDREALERYARALSGAGQPAAAHATAGASATLAADFATETIGPLTLRRQSATVRSGALGFALEARAERTDTRWRDPVLTIDRAETGLLLRAGSPALGGWTEASGGLRLRLDRDLWQAGLAHARRLSSFAEARLEAALNEPADESAPLRLEGVRRRVGGALTLSGGAVYARGSAVWKSWSWRSAGAVGDGGAADVEVGARMELAEAEVRMRLTAGHQRNSFHVGSGPAALAALGPILPEALTTFGLGATAAQWPIGPARLTADVWAGALSPPLRPAYRVQAGLAMTPFAGAELSLSAFAADDRFGGGGDRGATASLSYRIRG